MDHKDRTIAELRVELCERNIQLLKTQMSLLPNLLMEAELELVKAKDVLNPPIADTSAA
jgi:hypothetical protein